MFLTQQYVKETIQLNLTHARPNKFFKATFTSLYKSNMVLVCLSVCLYQRISLTDMVLLYIEAFHRSREGFEKGYRQITPVNKTSKLKVGQIKAIFPPPFIHIETDP